MLKSLSLNKFRAFNHASLDFSKLNIFVGPNNSGKSSVLSAINLIAQNLRSGSQEYSLALNGPYTQLGTFYDAVHGHSPRSKMGISFKFGNYTYSYSYKFRIQKKEIELAQASITDGDFHYQYKSATEDSAAALHFIKSDSLKIKIPIRTRPRFYGFYTNLPFGSMFPGGTIKVTNENYIKLRNFSFRSMRHLDEHFRSFDSIGAFRAAPERTYHYTGEAPTKVGRYGENFAQMLASSSSSRSKTDGNLIRQVSEWFKDSGVAKGVKINALTKRHFELQVEDSTGSSNNITDSGFGCSQVMPVLVGGLKLTNQSQNSMYIVQEPEIHLHPSAAAHLGSYFVGLANQGVQCFVETHSENIILRVARHIADGSIKAGDVRIYWVSGSSGAHDVTSLAVNSEGTFSTKWPEGFFPTRALGAKLFAQWARSKCFCRCLVRQAVFAD